jgi:hypothetical protein
MSSPARCRAALVACLVLTTAEGAIPQAIAAPSDRELAEAKRRFTRANQLYDDGRYEESLRLYVAAYELVPSLDILFNIGLAREKVLDHEGCALAFRDYLATAGQDDPLRERAEAGSQRCRERTAIPVKISSIPPGAAVSIGEGDEATFRGRTPSALNLAPGRHVISIELPGHAPMSQTVQVEIGARPEIDFPLERLSSIAIEADVAGALVAIDGGASEPAPLRREVVAGSYKVRVSKEGHETLEREVRIAPGEQSTLMMSLPRLAARRRVRFRSNLPAEVEVGGRRLGTTPLTRALAVGTEQVVVRAPNRVPFAGHITIPADRDLLLEVSLEPRRTRGERWLLRGLAAASVGAAAGAVVSGALALSAESEFTDRPSLATAERGRAHAYRADVLWGTSAALAAAALLTYVSTDRTSRAVTVPR